MPVLVHTPTQGGITDITIKLRHYCALCHLRVFNTIFHLDYVGSSDNLDAKTIESIGTTLHRFSMVYLLHGETRYSSPDAIYQHYLEELPMLPDDTETWGFNLVNMFWTALTDYIQQLCMA